MIQMIIYTVGVAALLLGSVLGIQLAISWTMWRFANPVVVGKSYLQHQLAIRGVPSPGKRSAIGKKLANYGIDQPEIPTELVFSGVAWALKQAAYDKDNGTLDRFIFRAALDRAATLTHLAYTNQSFQNFDDELDWDEIASTAERLESNSTPKKCT